MRKKYRLGKTIALKASIKQTDNLNFKNFIMKSRDKLYKEGRNNINLNNTGYPTISKKDDWFCDDIWNNNYP